MVTPNGPLPIIIQGGMGVGVSGWRLARAVSRTGQLGVVSGTALSLLLTRRLQVGDPDGHVLGPSRTFPSPKSRKASLIAITSPAASPATGRSKPFRYPPFRSAGYMKSCWWLATLSKCFSPKRDTMA